jgi:hypothetical protein
MNSFKSASQLICRGRFGSSRGAVVAAGFFELSSSLLAFTALD